MYVLRFVSQGSYRGLVFVTLSSAVESSDLDSLPAEHLCLCWLCGPLTRFITH